MCFALSGYLIHPENYTSALPTTLTELYQTAIHDFEEYHHRNADGKSTREETLKKLQLISFRDGMANGQLIFDQDLLDEQTEKSGLVNSLSNPVSPVKTSELNKTGTLPPHKLAYNQLKPNFMSRHACLDIKSRV